MKIPPVSLYPLRTFEDPDVVAPEYCYFEPARKPHWLNSIMNNQASQHDTTDDLPAPTAHKGSLAFILGPPTISTSTPVYPAQPLQYNQLSGSSGSETESDNDSNKTRAHPKRRRVSGANQQDDLASVRSQSPGKKGSKYCIVDGCTSRAKHARKCWKHGGSVKCKVTDCINRAKSKGVCWSHGGGTICSHAQCATIAVSHGFCWAHGGGKRCQVSGCSRPAYERTDNFCTTHHKQHLRGTLPQP